MKWWGGDLPLCGSCCVECTHVNKRHGDFVRLGRALRAGRSGGEVYLWAFYQTYLPVKTFSLGENDIIRLRLGHFYIYASFYLYAHTTR